MAPGRPSTNRKDKHGRPHTLAPRPLQTLPVALAILLAVTGLLVFAHAQTQPLFQNTGEEATSTQNPRNDTGTLSGALLTITGMTLLLAMTSPLRPSNRLIPAIVFAASTSALMIAHFSIFTNGIAFPEQGVFSVRSSYLFHDTTATIPIATSALAFITLLALLATCLSALALLAPRMLTVTLLRPDTLNGHRTRFLLVTLLLLGAGSMFVRQFVAFAFDAAVSLDSRAMAMAYLLMGGLLTAVLIMVTWRSARHLWGDLKTRTATRFRRSCDRFMRLETGLWTMLLVFTGITLLGEPVWQPPAGTDPVFAMSSTGASWIFLVVLGVYLTHRWLTRTYTEHLITTDEPLPRIGSDRLLAFGLFAVLTWTLGALWSVPPETSPLAALALRLLPIVLVMPVVAYWPATGGKTAKPHDGKVPLLLSWTVISALTGIMLWGIGNSVDIRFNALSGGLMDTQGGLVAGGTAAIRLIGSLLIVTPIILLLRLLAQEQGNRHTLGSSLIAGTAAVFVLNVLFTITPTTRYNPFAGENLVLVATWSNSLATTTDITIIGSLIALTITLGLVTTTRLLHRSAELVPYPLPATGALREWSHKVRWPSALRRKEEQARRASRASAVQDE